MPWAGSGLKIQLVRVTTDELIDGVATTQLWAVAAPPEKAVALVLTSVPEGWTVAVLSERRLTPREVASLKLNPGDAAKLFE